MRVIRKRSAAEVGMQLCLDLQNFLFCVGSADLRRIQHARPYILSWNESDYTKMLRTVGSERQRTKWHIKSES